MDVVEAFYFLNETVYFAKPVYKSNGDLLTFEIALRDAIYIYPMKIKNKIKWVCEYGSFSLESGVYYHDYKNDIIESSYEKCIIKLAKRIKKLVGKKQLIDYMNMKLPKITWESEKILKFIRKLEKK